MPTALNPADYPTEKGTLPLVCTFTDSDGDPLTLDTLSWSLRDGVGIVNSRDVITVTPAASVTIVLSGLDLAIGAGGPGRVLTLQGTFTSTLGADKPYTDEITFEIVRLHGVS